MPGSPREVSRFDHASIIRHLAICIAVLVAWFAREQLRVGNSVLWIFALAALLNLRPGRVARNLSPLLGLGAWTALMFLTGGVRSPFIAGLSLEIVLSALTTSTRGIALVTGGAVLCVWGQQAALDLEETLLDSTVSSGFLLAMGGLTGYLSSRWKRTERRLSLHDEELRGRLKTLERELEQARTIGILGRNVARLSHGLKNSVHSLRGFVGLLEPDVHASGREFEILTGLRTAIDHLEIIASTTLGPPGPSAGVPHSEGNKTPDTVKEVVRDLANSFPSIHWSLSVGEELPPINASPEELREVLSIVARNAAEAMQGSGEVAVEAVPRGAALEIQIRDSGPGIPESCRSRLFEPGYTTKASGHGLGLYIARRIVETRGGAVRVDAAPGGGTLCSIELPFLEPAGSR